MSTGNRLMLKTIGTRPIMPRNLPGNTDRKVCVCVSKKVELEVTSGSAKLASYRWSNFYVDVGVDTDWLLSPPHMRSCEKRLEGISQLMEPMGERFWWKTWRGRIYVCVLHLTGNRNPHLPRLSYMGV